jgi:hypothetical protein
MESSEKAKNPPMTVDEDGKIYDGHTVGKGYRKKHINGSNKTVNSPTSVPNKLE